MKTIQCPLCNAPVVETPLYFSDKRRRYHQCNSCKLVFVNPNDRLNSQDELAEYQLHNNDLEDEGYKRFLSRTFDAILPLASTLQNALDFGCGPAPLLARMLEEIGIDTAVYDPFFAKDKSVLDYRYSLITCTEAIEHFHEPRKEIELWNSLLAPNGVLVIMTKRVIDQTRFKTWHYKNDPTHVSFFSDDTFHFLSNRYGYEVSFPNNDVVLMKKL